MKAFVITIEGHRESETASQRCIESSWKVKNEFSIEVFDATTPVNAEDQLREFGLKWNYPWEGQIHDFSTGLIKSAYQTANPLARVACALSHFRLWAECFESQEPYLILEHDAFFTQKLDYEYIVNSAYDIVGINNPLGCTRRSKEFYNAVQLGGMDIQQVPRIDNFNIPQGIAGNSAYIMQPQGAEKMVSLAYKHGLWPNDSLMCYQLVGSNLGVTKEFYTSVQQMRSTTTQ